jgi:hypothetical protein
MKTPIHLRHKPIVTVDDYHLKDGKFPGNHTDAKALSVGLAQWENSNKDISAKVFRNKNNKWLRSSEELPLHRVLDLSILTISSLIKDPNNLQSTTDLMEDVLKSNDLNLIQDYFKANQAVLINRIDELQKVITLFKQRFKP